MCCDDNSLIRLILRGIQQGVLKRPQGKAVAFDGTNNAASSCYILKCQQQGVCTCSCSFTVTFLEVMWERLESELDKKLDTIVTAVTAVEDDTLEPLNHT